VDGLSPVERGFDLESYPLKIPISLISDPQLATLIRDNFAIPSSNLDPQKMTVVAMTGVTALVRATAYEMEQHGITYPAQDIRDWLRDADITHISNEVPFAADCPYPDPVQPDVRFCSRDDYIQLLEDVGTDVVELTGDHFQDWGTEAMFHTLDLYRERGWLTYGGGANLAEGRNALLIDRSPNRIAFIGCNAKGGSFAQASETDPGAAACDMDWMAEEISRLKAEGYLVIATFQHFEYYTYSPQADQQRDFRQMADAGAAIVSGSQAHQPQGMDFRNGAFIHYGLGNLFFDQYSLCEACRQGFIDRHVFYDGRHISTQLLPIQFVDYARSRPMTIQESTELLQALFLASGWP
jgi:poly-gamma-glutamate synthesis protein (capsule biosynthesis protein)